MVIPLFVAIGGLALGAIGTLANVPGFGTYISQLLNNVFKGELPSLAHIVSLRRKGIISKEQYYDFCVLWGINQERSELIFNSEYDVGSLSDILTIYFRYRNTEYNKEQIDNEWLKKRLSSIGINPNEWNFILESNRPVPSIQDVISFVRKEAYNEEIVKRDRLDSELDDLYYQEAEKRGLTKEDARRYWIASWERPSIQQYFEFLHRLYDHPNEKIRFTKEDLRYAFNINDIAPIDRDRLEAISYHPLTRVDIARIFALGVWGDKTKAFPKIERAFRELGYNEENAKLMAEFVIKWKEPEDRDFTRSQVLQYYREGVLGEDDKAKAIELLKELGYTEDYIRIMLEFEDLQIVNGEERDKIEKIKRDFLNGEIKTDTDLWNELQKVPLKNNDIVKYIKEFNKEKQALAKSLPRTNAEKLYKAGKLTKDELIEILKAYNFKESIIEKYIESLTVPDIVKEERLTKKDLTDMVQAGVIKPSDYLERMMKIGFTREDVLLLLELNVDDFDESML